MVIDDNSGEFVFKIPDYPEELENRNENYQVNLEVINNINQLANDIKNASILYENNGPSFILETFDYFYLVIKHFKEIKPEVRDDAWHALYNSLISLHPFLKRFISNFQLDQRNHYQNILQMIAYPFIILSEMFEDKIDQSVDFGDKKRKIVQPTKYQELKSEAISVLNQILLLNLERIFEPSHYLNNFINIITRWVYKIVEHSVRLRLADSFQNICELISIALDRYKHNINYCMKIIELLQTKESVYNILSDLVAYNINHLPHLFLINDILDQIKSIDINILSRDCSGPRSIASFLVELADKCPDEMFKYITDLLEFLDEDSYLLRNAVLEIIANVIIKQFISPTIVKNVRIKNALLDKLEDHIHDVTSYTRSKVLTLWCNLLKNGAIPIDRLESVTKLIISRLYDRSCYVRKNAVHFLTMLLENNPCTMMAKKDLLIAMEKAEVMMKIMEEKVMEIIEKQQNNSSDDNNNESNNDQTINQSNEESDLDEVDDEETDVEDEQEANERKRKLKLNKKIGTKKKSKRMDAQEQAQHLLTIWCNLENSFYNYWIKNECLLKEKLYNDLSFPDDLPKDDIQKGFDYFRKLVINKEYENALVALFALKSLHPNDKYLKLRKCHFKENFDEDEDDDDDDGDDNIDDEADGDEADEESEVDQINKYLNEENADTEEVNLTKNVGKGNMYLYDLNDKLFISTMSYVIIGNFIIYRFVFNFFFFSQKFQ